MKIFGSCHLAINRNPMVIVATFVTVWMVFVSVKTSTQLLKWTPSTNVNISPHYHAHIGAMLDVLPSEVPPSQYRL